MALQFDLSLDEIPIFLAETDEQIQVLEEGLIKLEREEANDPLLQAIFRAAHTLKGASGMIGHTRMAELTHALESLLDELRKGTIEVNPSLIDTCLETVDALRVLRDEVAEDQIGKIEIESLMLKLQAETKSKRGRASRARSTKSKSAATSSRQEKAEGSGERSSSEGKKKARSQPKSRRSSGTKADGRRLRVEAEISTKSAAPAARALQLMMALQALGSIENMEPDQKQIEASAPIERFSADLISERNKDDIQRALQSISEIDRLIIDGEVVIDAVAESSNGGRQPQEVPRLGEYLVKKGLISKAQLEKALLTQESQPEKLFGQILVEAGILTQDTLDRAIAEQMQQMRSALQATKSESAKPSQKGGEKTVRTSIERLDNLMNLIGELITNRNRLFRIRSELAARSHGDMLLDHLDITTNQIGRITDQLQEEVMRIRMLPVGNVFAKYPRLVRDLARKAQKQVDFVIRGEETELDRSVLEHIGDPLIHLLRNSVDHGIEPPQERVAAGKPERGRIVLEARQEKGEVIITVSDDGRGIDLERVKQSAINKGILREAEAASLSDTEAIELIFESGLSTAEVVSDISGRGVGMDIVRNNIEKLNGTVMVETRPGQGTEFTITLPLTLAILPVLLVKVSQATYAIPLAAIDETMKISPDSIQSVDGKSTILLRGKVLPLVRLGELFNTSNGTHRAKDEYIVAVRAGRNSLGLVVDGFIRKQEVTIKNIGDLVGKAQGISGAAILGDGQVALILDVAGVARLAASTRTSTEAPVNTPSKEKATET